MENGADEQVDTGADDSPESFTDDQSNDDGAENGALEEGAVGSEADQFDRNSPEARYWQSEKDKAVGKLEAKLSRLEAQVTGGRLQGQTQAAEPSLDEILNPESFQAPQIPAGELAEMGLDDRVLALLDQRFDQRMQAWTKHTLNGVNSYNQRAYAQQQQNAAAQKIGSFVETHIDKRDDILRIYDEMPDIAARNPDRFIRLVEVELGLKQPTQQQPSKRGLATAISSSSTRPTRNGNAPARTPAPTSLREVIAGRVDDYLRRTGRQ